MIVARWLVLGLLAAAVAGCSSGGSPGGPSSAAPSAASSAPPGPPTWSPTPSPASSPTRPRTSQARPTPAPIAPLSATQRAEGLVDIRTVVPDALVDLRYATTHNFTGVQLYPIDARCLVHSSMVDGLRVAAARLRRAGYRLVFWDCYRPHSVQMRMFEAVPDPNWVARPGRYARSHESARSVDVSLASAVAGATCPAGRVQGHCLVDMGTGFDDFTPRAYAFATDGVSAAARANRARLRSAMNAGGLTVYEGEWWHFDGPGSLVGRPLLQSTVD